MNALSVQQRIRQAMQLHRQGELAQAGDIYSAILQSQPGHPDALHLLGLVCLQQGDYEAAVNHIRKAIEQVPGQPVLRNNLGDALRKAGDLAGAEQELRRALELQADYAGAHQNLASVLADAGDHEGALRHGREAVRLDPRKAEAWFNLGLFLLDQVLLDESIQSFRQALVLRPQYIAAANSLLYVLNLLPGTDPAAVAQEHREVASILFSAATPALPAPAHKGPIRIGYVSGDFRAHAVNYFFEPLLQQHDPGRFETYCYSDVTRPDPVTQRLRKLARHWRDISGLSDAAVGALVAADEIDILVDLAGYTEYNRLGVFASKPARCQLSYLGYPNTSGLAAMDFRVVDTVTAPAQEPLAGPEKAMRLSPVFACFRPPAHAPAVQAPPFLSNGFLTFGCLHKLEKLNVRVIEVWSRILRENPGSRLLLARDQLDDWQQQRLKGQFVSQGVNAGQLEMLHLSDPARSFFHVFSRIDVLLDCFPWSGHTLACCSLWMGVPVISLQGDTHAGRMVASALIALRLEEWIAADVEAYVRLASGLGQDRQRLATLRSGLRKRMETSALRDETAFTRGFEKACLAAIGS